MKKVLFVCLLALASCAPNREYRDYSEEIDREVSAAVDEAQDFKAAVANNTYGATAEVVKFQYEGHTYIWFAKSRQRGERGFGFAGVVHDPDCICFNE